MKTSIYIKWFFSSGPLKKKTILYFLFILMIFWGNTSDAILIEAEDASIKTTGAPINEGWNLLSNGSLGEYFRIKAAGSYEVAVYAAGSQLEGVWPLMSLNVNGIATRDVKTIATTTFTKYTFHTELTASVHIIGCIFLNDAYKPDLGDRNLLIDKIEISPIQSTDDPLIASEEEWHTSAKEREDLVLQKTNEAIKKYRMGSASITVIDDKGNLIPNVSIAIEQIEHDFLFGCNIFRFDKFSTETDNTIYKERFKELFNYATVPFYWRWFEPKQGEPDYKYMDKIVEWSKRNGIRLKGHPLLWDSEIGIPTWSDGQPSPAIQKQRVTEIIKKYNSYIDFWEVVNEPAHLPNIDIVDPYQWATEASDTANLIINDYGVFDDGYPPFFELLEKAIKNEVPFNGIGIQAHEPTDMAFPLDRVQNILDMYATLGKEIHITEFTPQSSLKKVTGSPWRNIWDEEQQADYAEKFYRVCFAHPAVYAINWWSLSDQNSWLKGGGLLRSDFSPKPAYKALKNLTLNEWHTKVDGKTSISGHFQFSGFYGYYRVTASIDKMVKGKIFHLERDKQNNLILEMVENGLSSLKNFRIIE